MHTEVQKSIHSLDDLEYLHLLLLQICAIFTIFYNTYFYKLPVGNMATVHQHHVQKQLSEHDMKLEEKQMKMPHNFIIDIYSYKTALVKKIIIFSSASRFLHRCSNQLFQERKNILSQSLTLVL